MKRLFCIAIAALLLAANLANAGDKIAVGVSAARADVDVKDVGIDVNGVATGWRFFGLYKFSDRFGLEAGLSSFDRPDDPTLPSTLEVEAYSIDLFAVGTFPVSEKLDLFGKAGFVRFNTEVEEDELTEFSTQSTDLALGFGGEYELNSRFAIRGEYQWTDSQNAGAQNTLSLSGLFWFQ